MATTVSLRGRTKVKRVIVGKPIRRINQSSGSLGALSDVSNVNFVNGAILVYNSESNQWEATTELNQQEVNGGQY